MSAQLQSRSDGDLQGRLDRAALARALSPPARTGGAGIAAYQLLHRLDIATRVQDGNRSRRMRDAGTSRQGDGSPGPSSLPDVNVESNPYETVQELLDRAATFNLYAAPDSRQREAAPLTPGSPDDLFGINGGYGFDVRSELRQLEAVAGLDEAGKFRVQQGLGSGVGFFRSRLMLSAEDAAWSPGTLPPPRMFDPGHPQSFVMVDPLFSFGDGEDLLLGYGVGRTFPTVVDGRPRLFVGGVGNVTRGRGRLRGVEGTFVLNGELRGLGFCGNVSCRLLDPEGIFQADREPPPVPSTREVIPDTTYIVMRGEKLDRTTRTEVGSPRRDGLASLVTSGDVLSVDYRSTRDPASGLTAWMLPGERIARVQTTMVLDILAPPGTAEAPNAPTMTHVYSFFGPDGGEIGSITAEVILGRSFQVRFPTLPEQEALRYGGVGPIRGGTGRFSGVQGTLSVNSAVGIAPHLLSMQNVLQVADLGASLQGGAR